MSNQPPIHSFPSLTPTSTETAVSTRPPRLPKVMVAIATSDWKLELHTSESVRILCAGCKCETAVRYMMNDGVARARNNLAWQFLQSDADILFFLDSDIIIEPWQFQRLLDAVWIKGYRVVGGMYPKKQGILDWVVNYIHNERPNEDGFMRAKHLGNGCMLVAREELQSQIAKHPEMLYKGDPEPSAVRYDFFPMRAVNGSYLSEDWAFCDRIIEDGGEMWMDTRCQLRHVGKTVYPLQFTLSDEEVVDLIYHRYGMFPDQIRTFLGAGLRKPGLMGGHRARNVRLWPSDYPVDDLFDGDVLAGAYDLPINHTVKDKAPIILDLGACVGSFTKWAVKRWKGASVHAYEPAYEQFQFLERTIKEIPVATEGQVVQAYHQEIGLDEVSKLPDATILKIDLPGQERSIIEAFQACDKIQNLDGIVVRYHSDLDAFFLNTLLSPTHALHCHQRYAPTEDNKTNGNGVIKFVNRKIEPFVVMTRQD